MSMQEIKLRDEIFPLLLSGKKKTTTRKGKREINLDLMRIVATDGTVEPVVKMVSRVEYVRMVNMTEEDAINDGYDSLAEWRGVMWSIYGELPGDEIITIIHFECEG